MSEFLETLVAVPLPPGFKPGGFDCEEPDLTGYLVDGNASEDVRRSFSRCYLVMQDGELVGYFAVLADGIRLKTKERPPGVTYSTAAVRHSDGG